MDSCGPLAATLNPIAHLATRVASDLVYSVDLRRTTSNSPARYLQQPPTRFLDGDRNPSRLLVCLRPFSISSPACGDSLFSPASHRPAPPATMAQFHSQQPPYGAQTSAQNLQFYPSSYSSVSGHTTPSQASYGGYGVPPSQAVPAYPVGAGGVYGGFGSPAAGVSGRMGEQGGLRTGWLAAFGTEGYEGEPPLLEELGVNFEHIRTKVRFSRQQQCLLCLGVYAKKRKKEIWRKKWRERERGRETHMLTPARRH